MKSSNNILRPLPAVLALVAAGWGMSAYAQSDAAPAATTPTAMSRAEAASKKAGDATDRVGNKAVNAVRNADGGKAGAAVARTGEKIGDKLPQTAAYKKKNKGKKTRAKPVPEAG